MKRVTACASSVMFAWMLGLPFVVSAESNVLFRDDFSYATAGTISNPSSSVWKTADYYSVYTYIYSAGGVVKLGKSGAGGVLTTTNLTISGGTLAVQVDALGWSASERAFSIEVDGTNYPFTCAHDKSTSTQFETFTQEVAVAAGVMAVTFQSATDKRILLDNILITHTPGEAADELEFYVYNHPAASVPALTEISFTIIAQVGGTSTNVIYLGGLPTGAYYSFTNGLFSWTPTLEQIDTYALTFAASNTTGSVHEKTVTVTVTPLPLSAPAGLSVSDIRCNAFRLSWEPVPSATNGYRVDVWYGSTATNTPVADLETFFEISDSGNVVAPDGWTFSGVTEKYSTAGMVELKFNDAGDTLTTKLYPAPVTALAFRLKGYNTHPASNNVFTIYGSSDGGTTWTPLQSYSTRADDDGDDENNIFTSMDRDLDKMITLDENEGYRKFRFVFETKELGNIGLAQVAATYSRSGTRFVRGWQAAPVVATNLWVSTVPHARELVVRVGAQAGDEIQSSQIRLTTPVCPRQTLFIVR